MALPSKTKTVLARTICMWAALAVAGEATAQPPSLGSPAAKVALAKCIRADAGGHHGQRTYLLEAVSREGATYTRAISWNYPQEQMQVLAPAADDAGSRNRRLGSVHRPTLLRRSRR